MSKNMPDQFPDELQNKMLHVKNMSKRISDIMSASMPDGVPDKGRIECQLVGMTRRKCFILACCVYLSIDACRLWVKVQGGRSYIIRAATLVVHTFVGWRVRNVGFGLRTSI